ncbi:MAG: ATP-binding protein [Bacteroidota bacterium]
MLLLSRLLLKKLIAGSLFWFFATNILPAQSTNSPDPYLESLFSIIDVRLDQAGGDTARYFILEAVRSHCGKDLDCQYEMYDKVLGKLERANEYWAGIPVAQKMRELAQQKKEIQKEIAALKRLIDLYNYINAIGRIAFFREQLLDLYEQAGDQAGTIRTKIRILEQRAWELDEAHIVLPDIEELFAQSLELDDPETSNFLRLRLKYLYEEFGYDDKLRKIVEALETIVASDSSQFSESRYAFHAASGRADLLFKQKQYAQAEALYQKALGIARLRHRAHHDTWLKIYAFHRLAKLEWEARNNDKALVHLDSAFLLSAEHKMYSRLIINYDMRIRIAEEERRFEDALRYTRNKYEQEALNDSATREFDVKKYHLQLEKEQLASEKENQALQLRLKNNQLSSLILVGVFVLFLTLGLLLGYRRQRQAKRELATQNVLIQQQAEELKSLDEAKMRFFANISHELRTPLTLILGPLSNMLDQPDVWEKESVQQQLTVMQRNGKSLLSLIEEILDLSKLEANKLDLVEKPTKIQAFVEQVFSQFTSQFDNQRIHYDLDIEVEEGLTVELDSQKIEKVLNNFLSNAIKFTPEGGRIRMGVTETAQTLQCVVADSGKGIQVEDLPHVFDRFYQAKHNDQAEQGGTGIGLSFVKEIAQLMRGKVYAESKPGEGSHFYFDIPKKVVSASAQVVDEFEVLPDQDPIYSIGKDFTILVVEDNQDMRMFIHRLLSPNFEQILLAKNGREGLELLQQHGQTIDLIVSDIMMPELDGMSMLKEIKSHTDWQQIPVVMLTALASERDKLSALTVGVDDYLTKPFSVQELLVRVQNLLYNAQQRKEWHQSEEFQTENEALEIAGASLNASHKAWLGQLKALVKDSFAEGRHTAESLAEAAHMSPRQLRRRLKSITGLSTVKFIQEVQLQHARQHMEAGSRKSLADIAFESGFEHQRTFSSLFKARFGKSPREYLKSAAG